MADAARENVLRLVPKLSELQLLEITAGLGLTLDKDKVKKDRKTALKNLFVRYLASEEVEDSMMRG